MWLNGERLGSHTGGYDAHSYVLPAPLLAGTNELIVFAFDPSDLGAQPEGKQRIKSILSPGGDKYSPSSGIWGAVWLEAAPPARIERVVVTTSLTAVTLNVTAVGTPLGTRVTAAVTLQGRAITTGAGVSGAPFTLPIPTPQLWSPASPTLYDIALTLEGGDAVTTYAGLRTITLVDGGVAGFDRPGHGGVPLRAASRRPPPVRGCMQRER